MPLVEETEERVEIALVQGPSICLELADAIVELALVLAHHLPHFDLRLLEACHDIILFHTLSSLDKLVTADIKHRLEPSDTDTGNFSCLGAAVDIDNILLFHIMLMPIARLKLHYSLVGFKSEGPFSMIKSGFMTMDWFFANTRTNVDTEHNNARAYKDATSSAWQMTGQTDSGCSETMNPAAAMADQPGFIPTAGFGLAGGCKVDENTELKWGNPDAWRVKGPKQLWARPFSTTPFMSGGDPGAVDNESKLIHSQLQRHPKDISTIMDKFIPNYYQPLLASKDADYKNVNNWVEVDGWIRGGDPTRLVMQSVQPNTAAPVPSAFS